MATFNFANDFFEDLFEGVHDFQNDQFTIALSNTAPGSETSDPTASGNGALANVTEVAYTNLSSRNITTSSSEETSGTQKVVFSDLTLTSTGGSTGPFRYVYVYNETSTGDRIVGYYDYGTNLTLNANESLAIDFDDTNGFLQGTSA